MDTRLKARRRRTRIGGLLLTALIGLHWLISGHSIRGDFYWDESVYADISSHPLTSTFYEGSDRKWVRHPPLLFGLQGLAAGLPFPEEVSFRMASLLCSSVGLAFVFAVLLSIGRPDLGLGCCLLLVFHTLFQQYSQSATIYAPLFMFSAVLFFAVVTNRAWLQVIAMVGALYTHYFAFLWLFALVVFDAAAHGRRFWRDAGVKYLVIVALYSPWIGELAPGLAFHRSRQFRRWQLAASLGNILQVVGVGGLGMLLWWNAQHLRPARVRKLARGSSRDRLLLFGLGSAAAVLPVVACAKPFLRYLYFGFPIWLAAMLVLTASHPFFSERFFTERRAWIRAAGATLAAGLAVSVPNWTAFGVFPDSARHFDLNDSIHHQEWREIVRLVEGASIATDNVRSYYYYYRQAHPERPPHPYPWDDIGIFVLKRDVLETARPQYAVVRKPDHPKAVERMAARGYRVHRDLRHHWLFRRVDS